MIPHLVAVAEDFQRTTLIEKAESSLPPDPELVGKLWERTERDVDGSWEKQADAWKGWYGINWKLRTTNQRFDGFVEVRNAIIHGQGQLTRRQVRREPAVLAAIKASGVPVDKGRVVVDDQSVSDCADEMIAFISWLDFEAQRVLT